MFVGQFGAFSLTTIGAYIEPITMSLLRSSPVRNAASPTAARSVGVGEPFWAPYSPISTCGRLRSAVS
jgi:hypothetical protein